MSQTIFLDGTLYVKNKLDMVNQCLLAIGEAPYPNGTLVSTMPLGTDGETASRLVNATMVDVQTKGWYFNTDYDFKLYTDSNSFITIPPNTLKVDFGIGEGNRYQAKNGRVYDMQEQTFYLEDVTYLTADIIWLVDYEELPPEAYEYIALRSARKFQQKVIGSTETAKFTERDELDSYTNLYRLQLQVNDYNLQNSRVSTRTHNGYLVAGLYGNKGRRSY